MKKNNLLFVAMVTLMVAFVACKSDKTADGSATSATTPAADPAAPAPTPGASNAQKAISDPVRYGQDYAARQLTSFIPNACQDQHDSQYPVTAATEQPHADHTKT